jgi:hypothetical protein
MSQVAPCCVKPRLGRQHGGFSLKGATLRRVGVVACGDVRVVESAFSVDAGREIVGAGALSFGHHEAARVARVRCGFGWRQLAGWFAQHREQDPTARPCGVGVSSRRRPDEGAVGKLHIAPPAGAGPKRAQQMMKPDGSSTFRAASAQQVHRRSQ